MKRFQARFTVRRMMGLIAVVALLIATGLWAFDRYWSNGIVVSYPVGDLLAIQRTGFIFTDLPDFGERLKSSVTPDVWWSRRRTVIPFDLFAVARRSG